MLRLISRDIGCLGRNLGKNARVGTTGSRWIVSSSSTANGTGVKRVVSVDREFPDPFAQQKQNRKYFVAYGLGVTVACLFIFNYEKTRSPITNSTLFFLRRSSIAKEHLGEGIDFKSSWPWIWGPLNTVKGDIDIEFSIKGEKGDGVLRLKATRESKLHPFNVHRLSLEVKGVEYDLLKDPSIDFDI